MNINKQVGVRLSEKDVLQIRKSIEAGCAINVADFIRQAIREKLMKEAA